VWQRPSDACPLNSSGSQPVVEGSWLRLTSPLEHGYELGNALFVYAAIRGLATHHGVHAPSLGSAPAVVRNFTLGRCGSAAFQQLLTRLHCCAPRRAVPVINAAVTTNPRMFLSFPAAERESALLQPGADRTRHRLGMLPSGYFQSWRYWCNVDALLRTELRALFGTCSAAAVRGPELGNASSGRGRGRTVAVHIRLGDYVQHGPRVVGRYAAFLAASFRWHVRRDPDVRFLVMCAQQIDSVRRPMLHAAS
jgi:hypothetical protein